MVTVIGNHTPRQCGIATFTAHLSDALGDEIPGLDCFVLAVNDTGRRHAYTIGADGDTIHLYYGAADSCIALATGSVRGLLAWLSRNGRGC